MYFVLIIYDIEVIRSGFENKLLLQNVRVNLYYVRIVLLVFFYRYYDGRYRGYYIFAKSLCIIFGIDSEVVYRIRGYCYIEELFLGIISNRIDIKD